MKWFGHVARMPHHRLPLQAYTNYFTQRRPPGRPPTRRRDQIQGDLGVPLQEAEHQAQGRTEWRRITRRRAKGHPVLCIYVKVSQSNLQKTTYMLFSNSIKIVHGDVLFNNVRIERVLHQLNFLDYTGWPRKNATILIVNFNDIVNKINLFFIVLGGKFIYQQNDTMPTKIWKGIWILGLF